MGSLMRRDAVMPPAGLATPSALDASPLLPRLAAAAARGLTRAYTAQAPLAVTIGTTPYQLAWRAHAAPADDARAYRFAVGPAHGTLWIDTLAEHTWLGDAAHEAVPPVLRCALLADLCAGMIAGLQALTRQHVELLPPPVGQPFNAPAAAAGHESEPFAARGWRTDPAALCFELSRAQDGWRCHGALTFDTPDALGVFFGGAPAPAAGASTTFAQLPVPLTFEIGRTELTVAELSDVVRGDIIAIERWRAKGQNLLCSARVPGTPGWEIEGRPTGNRIVVERIKEMPLEQSQSPDSSPASATSAAGAADDAPQQAGARQLDTLAIDLGFELPSRSMPLAELGALQPGAVIEMEQGINQSVIHLVANGMLIGTGTLIAVGQKLGVRVTAINPPAPHNARER
ncbi:YscQ/HrcQ family type III secretion apparatus protein [Paraburkholderia sp. RL16-012-BIC-B]|nr:YscQ/HrcQ family type III secretion apparatus protein [Paraburkholderia madseniana]